MADNNQNNDDQEAMFEYDGQEIDIYLKHDPLEKLRFEDFVIQLASDFELQFFDRLLVENLKAEGIIEMNPIQLATMQACFFAWPNPDEAPDFYGTAPTGEGKSHAFLVPLIQKCIDRKNQNPEAPLTPLGLIFVHTKQLVNELYKKALPLVKGTGIIIKPLTNGSPFLTDSYFDIGICTMGRFRNHFGSEGEDNRVTISLDQLEYLVIDEADKMAEEADFLPIFDEIKATKSNISTMVFSATPDSLISYFLNLSNLYNFGCGKINSVAPTIKMYCAEVNSRNPSQIYGSPAGGIVEPPTADIGHPFDTLYTFLVNRFLKSKRGNRRAEKAIVFVKRTAVADLIARRLTQFGFPAVSVHSRQDRDLQDRKLNAFKAGEVRILTATNQLTRGIDMEIDYVINYDLPLNYKDFIHRCGRTGRNGNKGYAITFYDLKNDTDYDPKVLQNIVLNNDIRSPSQSLLEFKEAAIEHREYEIQICNAALENRPHF